MVTTTTTMMTTTTTMMTMMTTTTMMMTMMMTTTRSKSFFALPWTFNLRRTLHTLFLLRSHNPIHQKPTLVPSPCHGPAKHNTPRRNSTLPNQKWRPTQPSPL